MGPLLGRLDRAGWIFVGMGGFIEEGVGFWQGVGVVRQEMVDG